MLFAYRVKNHDDKIKDRELREWYDILEIRNKWKKWEISYNEKILYYKSQENYEKVNVN